jgi:hypothetical protein
VYTAAQMGNVNVIRCLVKEFGADINIAAEDGSTPIMAAAERKHGANSQASHPRAGTAADFSKVHGALAEQTVCTWRRGRTARNPGAKAWGSRSAGCLVIFYCCKECQVAH